MSSSTPSRRRSTKWPSRITDPMLHQYQLMFPMRPSGWQYQTQYLVERPSNRWYAGTGDLTAALYRKHLNRRSEYWIAARCPEEDGIPVTDFLLLDLDADPNRGGRDAAWDRLQRIMDVIGREFVPLVFSSPGGGLHAIYFLQEATPVYDLVEKGRSASAGLIADLVRQAIGEFGAPVCEVFPQNGLRIRLPLGRSQYPVDPETGHPRQIEDERKLLNEAFDHWATATPLTLAHLRALRGLPPEGDVQGSVRSKGTDETTLARARQAGRLPTHSVEAARRLFHEGLTMSGTRNRSMYELARGMVYEPHALAEFGFDPEGDPAEQLFDWLETAHNGFSRDYPGTGTPESWRAECERVVRNAMARPPWNGFEEGRLLLTDAELDCVFEVGYHSTANVPRHKLEVVAASILGKAKSCVAHHGTAPSEDGTYMAQLHSRWFRQAKFCSSSANAAKYRTILEGVGLFRLEKRGSKWARRANIYGGFNLEFEGERRSLPLRPRVLQAMARKFALETPVLQYALEAEHRFPGDLLDKRYGQAGAKFIRLLVARMHRSAKQVEAAVAKANRAAFRTGTGYGLPVSRKEPSAQTEPEATGVLQQAA